MVAGKAAVVMGMFTIDGHKYFIRTRLYGDANTEPCTRKENFELELRRGPKEIARNDA